MTLEAVLMSAYALATQERYEEAESLLQSCPEAYNTVSGMDLLARIRHSQDRIGEARSIWQRILDVDPTNETARKAIDAIENPEPVSDNPYRKFIVAAVAAVVLGVIISVISTCCRKPVEVVGAEPSVVYVTNEVEKVVTKEVIKTVPEIDERVVTNIVDRLIEVKIPVKSVVTTEVERVIYVTNVVDRLIEVGVPIESVVTVVVERVVCETNIVENKVVDTDVVVGIPSMNDADNLSVPPKTGVDKVSSDGTTAESDGRTDAVKSPEVRRKVYCPEYVIKPGDEVLKLAKRYSFRIQDFRAVNPGVDENHVRAGQKVKIPGFFDEENLPK